MICHCSLAPEMDYSAFVSPVATKRKGAVFRELSKLRLKGPKESSSLVEGAPAEYVFPISKISVELKDKTSFTLEGSELVHALQYIVTTGYGPLVEKFRHLTKKYHNPPQWEMMGTLITTGSQDGISKVVELCMEIGDPVLVPNPLYVGAEVNMGPFNPKYIGIDQDDKGIVPESLYEALEDWSKKVKTGEETKMPRLLYLNPIGMNPSGATIPNDRRIKIYQICQRYNILILEDDPYYFLYYEKGETPKSFLSIDVDGRVLRCDSLSKIISPGIRLGWISGPAALLHLMETHLQSEYFHPSALSQVVTSKLLHSWDEKAMEHHLKSVRDFYRKRRDSLLKILDRHLTGLAEWTSPAAGFFIWVKITALPDIRDVLLSDCVRKGVYITPGYPFMVKDEPSMYQYIRASFSIAGDAEMERCISTLAELIREKLQA